MNFVISGRFHGLQHTVFAPGMISTARDRRYTVIWKSTKLVNLVIYGRIHGYITRFLAPAMISSARDPRDTVIWKLTKLMNFVILAVSWAIVHDFWLRGRFNGP